jgi:hypothetical protein
MFDMISYGRSNQFIPRQIDFRHNFSINLYGKGLIRSTNRIVPQVVNNIQRKSRRLYCDLITAWFTFTKD